MKFLIHVVGCTKRSLDAKRIKQFFIQNGCIPTKEPAEADIIILNTCAFDKDSEDKAIEAVKFYKKHAALLIVFGCLPNINKDLLRKYFDGAVIPPMELEKIDEYFPDFKIKFSAIVDDINDVTDDAFVYFSDIRQEGKPSLGEIMDQKYRQTRALFRILLKKKGFSLALLKGLYEFSKYRKMFHIGISIGCPNRCSYCGIRNAIGDLKSKSLEQIEREKEAGISSGFKNFHLISSDSLAYGIDISLTSPQLLRKFVLDKRVEGVFLSGTNPQWIIKYIDELIPIFETKKIKYASIAMQSGSERILRLMNRDPDLDGFAKKIKLLKSISPDTLFFTEFIIGFPTETIEEFHKTLQVVEDIGFDKVRFYRFDPKSGTIAKDMPGQIDAKDKDERFKEAEELFADML